MSMKALFGQYVGELQGQSWQVPEVQKLVDLLSAVWSSEAPIQLTEPLTLQNNTARPAIIVSGVADSRALQINMPGGLTASMGIGIGNEGIVANEFVPRPEYVLPPSVYDTQYSTTTNKAGGVTNTPGELPEATRPNNYQPNSGTGWVPSNVPTDVNGQTGQTISGRGRGTGYSGGVGAPPPIEHEVASGGGAGSGGSAPSGFPVLKRAGNIPVLKGRAQGSGAPGRTHDGMQTMTSWGDALGYGQHSSRGFEVTVGNKRYYWADGGTTGATAAVDVVTAVSCTAGALSVTTETLNFDRGLFTGVS